MYSFRLPSVVPYADYTDDNYIIYGVSNYLKGNLQLSYLKEGESILVISNGKVLLSDPYQFDKIYSIQLLQ